MRPYSVVASFYLINDYIVSIMSEAQVKRRRQMKLARLEIVGQLYKRGKSYRQIQAEVMARLDLSHYSLETVSRDIKTLLAEWRESRISNIDEAVQLELERIDDAVAELWSQWEKSKEDGVKKSRKRRASKAGNGQEGNAVEERSESDVIGLGNPMYIAEIRQQDIERRKLLGLYAASKTEITGKDGKDLNPSIVVEVIDSRDKVDENPND